MSSLNLKRFCSTKQIGSPGVLPSPAGRKNSYWLMTSLIFWRRTKTSCWFGSTVIGVRLDREHLPFDREQRALALQPARVAAQAARAGEHAVTGDDDRDRVGAQGPAGGAKGARRAGGDRH